MKALITSFLAICLCLGSSLALAKGDPGDGKQSGIDVFAPGMTKTDAKKLGAAPAGDDVMKGKVKWGDKQWDAVVTFKGDAASAVALSTKLTGNNLIFTMFQDMEERLYVPLFVTREAKGKKQEKDMAKQAAAGQDKDARNDAMTEEISAYADQEDGSVTVIFAPSDMVDEMAKVIKAQGDEKAALAKFGDTTSYSLTMERKGDKITVVVSTFANIGKM